MTEIDELDILTLTGLEVFAHHGVFDFERENGQRFVIDVALWLDTAPAAAGDALAETVHYGELAVEISDAVGADPVDLIETLAERVAGVVLAHEPVQRVRVVVHKPDAPITVPFGDVSITITRGRARSRAAVPGSGPVGAASSAAASAAPGPRPHRAETPLA
ncbi:dihydroneopterin aldolase [Herbiconiux sp. YIM B11900]|uniref:dihydroneopterin aldolase n=1 Tax=Herbiconiux sp. YIM B11900 TaxID=3404131 RepID=UPI003F864F5A